MAERNITPTEQARAYRVRALAYARLSQFAHAMDDFGEALRINPRDEFAFADRGAVWIMQGKYEKAIADFDQALEINPRDIYALKSRALSHQNLAAYPEAIADFDAAIAINPQDGDLLNGRCWVRMLAHRDLDQALQDCNEALRLTPNDANTLNSRAAVEFLRGDFQASEADYDVSYQAEQTMTGSLYGRGAAKVRLGQTAEGQADIAAATRQNPDVVRRYTSYGISATDQRPPQAPASN